MNGSGSITAGMWPASWEEPIRYSPKANDYIAHRLTVPVDDPEGGNTVGCDCGCWFPGVVDLEQHQHRFRHPGIFGTVYDVP